MAQRTNGQSKAEQASQKQPPGRYTTTSIRNYGRDCFCRLLRETLSLIPRSESPSALGQWASWVQLAMVLIGVLILRILTVEETEAHIPSTRKVYLRETKSMIAQTDTVDSGTGGENEIELRQTPRGFVAKIVKRFTDPVTKLEKGNVSGSDKIPLMCCC
jgi:hypothetical protein